MRLRLATVGAAALATLFGMVGIPVAAGAAGSAAAGAPVAAINPYSAIGASRAPWGRGTAAPAATAAGAYKVAAAAGPPVVIGVDNTPPPGKPGWEYTHYFPETAVNVPQGGVILWQWNAGSLNGFHSVTIASAGQSEAQLRAAYPFVQKDTDSGENDTIITPVANNPTSFSCSTGPTAPPCPYDGSSVVSSGIIPTFTGAAFAVQLSASLPVGTYHYYCLVHPGMNGSFNVVAAGQPATDPGTLASEGSSELNQLNAGAAAAEAAASVPSSTANADGTRTWTEHVGVTADDVELLEYLPQSLPIHKGDSVKFDASETSQEVHTVTTPGGAGAGMVPFSPNQCEAASGPDTLADPNVNGPPETGCADPSGYEQPVNTALQGEPSLISSPRTPAAAFISGASYAQGLGVAASHTYKLTNNGTYLFVCLIHANMAAIITTQGYRLAGSDGGVFTEGNVDFAGSKPGLASPVVAIPTTPDNQGYWLVTANGQTYNFGDAPNVGNVPLAVTSPIVGATIAQGQGGPPGLWLVSRDGGVFSLGGAPYYGSLGGKHLNAPIVGIAGGGQCQGYTLAAADGGVFAFGTDGNGNPRFFGSEGGTHLNQPIVGIAGTDDADGYLLAASDGGVFAFGDAMFYGSEGATHLNKPIVGIAMTADDLSLNGVAPGYRMVASDGGVFTFHASYDGSQGGSHLNAPVVGIGGDAI